MEGEVPLMTPKGEFVAMVKIPEGMDLPQIIEWKERFFLLQNGGFIEAAVYKAPE